MPAIACLHVWLHGHGLSGHIRPEVVDKPQGDAILRAHDTDTLYDVVIISVQLNIAVMQERCACGEAESKRKWRELLEMIGKHKKATCATHSMTSQNCFAY